LETSGQPPPDIRGDFSNPESFVIVHHVASRQPTDDAVQAATASEQTGGARAGSRPDDHLIEVPANARAGDPAYESEDVTVDDEGAWYWEDSAGTVYGPYGTAFAEGVELGYSALRRHGAPVHQRHRERRRAGDVAEFGANDLHRSAELEFSRAAQPRLAQQEEGFRRAQLQFHQATVTPGAARHADGLRHESAPSRPAPPHR
jgi:hypothetical protein